MSHRTAFPHSLPLALRTNPLSLPLPEAVGEPLPAGGVETTESDWFPNEVPKKYGRSGFSTSFFYYGVDGARGLCYF